VIGWKTACGTCAACRRGLPRQCKQPPLAAGRLHRAGGEVLMPVLRTGTFATRTVVPAVAAVKVPRELPAEQACLIACAVATGVMSAIETAQVWEGARVGVIGCGAVGLSVIQGARIAGASTIRAIDLDERKLEQAQRFGATDVGEGPVDFAFDVVGRKATFELGLSLLAGGGRSCSSVSRRAARRRSSTSPRLFGKRARILVSHGGDHLAARTSRGSRSGRSRASSTSRDGDEDGHADGVEGGLRRDGAGRRDPHGAQAVRRRLSAPSSGRAGFPRVRLRRRPGTRVLTVTL
jgi:Zn-dependent alcohol dehydrogenase